MAIVEKNTINPDNLFAGPEIPVLTKNYTLTPGTALKRGTLLTVTPEGAASATAIAGVASAVLACDVDEKATVCTAYVTGRFNRSALIAASGDTVDAHEEELRKVGIHLASKL
ncbi:hypothetical protein [Acidaminococcus provencensis]|uniref:hypothetical protein n=1 Tax=Acidaminococcus provencensis TaxID=2058289 RepID=UPI0022E8FB93|nr:hypothetical protein [Acidaminococcus provencensis]